MNFNWFRLHEMLGANPTVLKFRQEKRAIIALCLSILPDDILVLMISFHRIFPVDFPVAVHCETNILAGFKSQVLEND